MEDTADKKHKENRENVCKIASEIADMNGEKTVAMDISCQSSWTDFFIISSATSEAHLKGLYRNIYDLFDKLNITPLTKHKKNEINNWILIDCGYFVIHLMDKETREFYELEKLWFNSPVVYQSSKSS